MWSNYEHKTRHFTDMGNNSRNDHRAKQRTAGSRIYSQHNAARQMDELVDELDISMVGVFE